ncbi:MAG TPA: fumarate hydratase [Anaerohalosphaeraceae bacterium]|nr:fumarate hydratase [Anaerohalosphaeraceae bacterium]HQG05082.1 fumarate hydratase [Anaerohalosphaeraceae bacterium]HQI06255.1 fumarate hydratase [Anaerohalosphaeraceae bacterium]HQJ67125.1 fumarate hydratase [Anaerohalosphaeraceae bacterium]
MRSIAFDSIVRTTADLCIQAAYELPEDISAAVRKALQTESSPRARLILQQLLENAAVAAHERIPICQDTGLTVVFAEAGSEVRIAAPPEKGSATLMDAIQEGAALACKEGLLRASVAAEPLNKRLNTNTNTPAFVHLSIVPGERLRLSVLLKGGGCENKSRFEMFNPTESPQTVCRWIVQTVQDAGPNACPPFVVGVGLGGDFEWCCLLSKKALLRPVGSTHPDPFYASLEETLLKDIHALGLGPQGLGGDTTALAVHIETAPCHIASLPAAVNIDCHAHRHKTAVL